MNKKLWLLVLIAVAINFSSAAVYAEEGESEDGKMDPQELELIAQSWRPWRTVATWYLWRSLDPLPVVY